MCADCLIVQPCPRSALVSLSDSPKIEVDGNFFRCDYDKVLKKLKEAENAMKEGFMQKQLSLTYKLLELKKQREQLKQQGMYDEFLEKHIQGIQNAITWLDRKVNIHTQKVKECTEKYIESFIKLFEICGIYIEAIKKIIIGIIYLHDWGRVNELINEETGAISYGKGDQDHAVFSYKYIYEYLSDFYNQKFPNVIYYMLQAIRWHSALKEDIQEAEFTHYCNQQLFYVFYDFVTKMDRKADILQYIMPVEDKSNPNITHDIDRIGEMSNSNIKKMSIITQEKYKEFMDFINGSRLRPDKNTKPENTIIDTYLRLMSFMFNDDGSIDKELIAEEMPEKFLSLVEDRVIRYRNGVKRDDYIKTLECMQKIRNALFKKKYVKSAINQKVQLEKDLLVGITVIYLKPTCFLGI